MRAGSRQGSVFCAGFTLLEVLIALAILGMGIVMVIQLFSSNSRSILVSDNYSQSVLKAEELMRNLLDRPSLDIGAWSEETGDGYRADYEVAPVMTERTAALPFNMLSVDLALKKAVGPKQLSVRLHSVKLVEKPVLEDVTADAQKQ